MKPLDLYATCEHLLGIEDATEALHDLYLSYLLEYEPKTLLDIGCGRGGFIKKMLHEGVACRGIDASEVMVATCQKDGLDVLACGIGSVEGKFDVIVAIFDVLNFFDHENLLLFLDEVASRLDENGVFMADINTLYGFREVADGSMSSEDTEHFLSVDAKFDTDVLRTQFTLFHKTNPTCYTKYQSTLTQYFHKIKTFQNLKSLKLIEKQDFSLYDVKDKTFLVFKKR